MRRARLLGAAAVVACACIVAVLLMGAQSWTPGLLYYNDYGLPLSAHNALVTLARYNGAWDSYAYFGRPNALFFGTQLFLYAHVFLSTLFGPDWSSKIIPILLLAAGLLSMFSVMQRRFGWLASFAAATLYIANPWTYDQVVQGHLYLLEILPLVPVLFWYYFIREKWTRKDWAFATLALSAILLCDYHFAVLLAGTGALLWLGAAVASHVERRDLVSRIVSIPAAVCLLGILVVPYIVDAQAVLQENAPGANDLTYFSGFSSLMSSITLLRPLMNGGHAINLLPSGGFLLWYIAALGLAVASAYLAVTKSARKTWPSRLFGPFAIAACVAVVLGAGANSPAGPLIEWLYRHVPLASMFRDPSKFFLIVLLFYCTAIAVWIDNASSLTTLERGKSLTPALFIAVLVVLESPFLLYGNYLAQTFSFPSTDQVLGSIYDTVPPNSRIAILPPWNFVRYSGITNPVHDPLLLYPDAPLAGLDYNYDTSNANRFSQWLFGRLYFNRGLDFASLARVAGISRLAVRADVDVVTGDPLEDQVLSSSHLGTSLAAQRGLTFLSSHGAITEYSIRHARVARFVQRVDSIGASTLDTIGALATAGETFESAAPCFTDQCPSGVPRLTASFEDELQVAPGSNADLSSMRHGFSRQPDSWAQDYGALSGERARPLVADRSGSGEVRFSNLQPHKLYRAVIRLMTGPAAIRVRLACPHVRPIKTAVAASLTYRFAWIQLGTVVTTSSAAACSLSVSGASDIAISGLRLVPAGAAPANLPDVVFIDARATPGSNARRLINTIGTQGPSLQLSPGGMLRYVVDARLNGRQVYAFIQSATGGRIQLAGAPPIDAGGVTRFSWVALGRLTGSAVRVRNVSNVPLIVDLFAVSNRTLPLKPPSQRFDAISLIEGRNFKTTSRTILAWSEAGAGVWRIDGRAPAGGIAGFGQIYVLPPGGHRLRNVLVTYYWVGLVLSLLTLAGIAAVFWWPRLVRRIRHEITSG